MRTLQAELAHKRPDSLETRGRALLKKLPPEFRRVDIEALGVCWRIASQILTALHDVGAVKRLDRKNRAYWWRSIA